MNTLFKLSKYCFISGFVLWFTETLVFQIIYGWHYAPYNNTELYFDRAAGLLVTIGFWLCVIAVIKRFAALCQAAKRWHCVSGSLHKTDVIGWLR